MKNFFLLTIFSTLIIAGCSGPKKTLATRGLNPDFEPRKFESVALVSLLANDEQNTQWEARFIDELREEEFKVVPTFEQLQSIGLNKTAALNYLSTIQADGVVVTRIQLFGEKGESIGFVTQNDPGSVEHRPEQAAYVDSENYYAQIWPSYEFTRKNANWTKAAEFNITVAFYDLESKQLVWQGMSKRIKTKHFDKTYPRFMDEVTAAFIDLRKRYTN